VRSTFCVFAIHPFTASAATVDSRSLILCLVRRLESMFITSSYEERVIQALRDLAIPTSLVTQRRRPLHEECDDLVSIGLDMFGREQKLERIAASRWVAMRLAAERDGVMLAVVSAFRSFDYQRQIIARKLTAGLSVEQILEVSALPGFSEHHTGRAIDIGTPGCPPVTEEFEQTPAFNLVDTKSPGFWISNDVSERQSVRSDL
jgi:zinc D-Ala-D-Ala carboxypeptidase